MRSLLLTSILVATLVGSPRAVRAGAWLPTPGAVYARSSLLWLEADARRTCRGQAAAIGAFGGAYREVQSFTYVEYGWTEGVALLGSFAIKDARIVDARVPAYGTRSTGDLRIGVRWALLRGAFPVSLETLVSVPTYPESDPRQPESVRAQFLPAGSGQMEFEGALQVGRSLFPLPLYANAAVGRRERGGAFGDLWWLSFEVGATGPRWFAKSDVRGVFGEGDLCGSASAGAVTLNEQSWRWAPEVALRVADSWWVGAGVSRLLGGRNVLDATQWSLSFTWRHDPSGPG